MLEHVRIMNFKAHTDTTIDPGRLTCLVGPNGVGKTSVLQAIHYVSQLTYKSTGQLFRPGSQRDPYVLFNRKSKDPLSIEVAGTAEGKKWQVVVGLKPDCRTADPEDSDWLASLEWGFGNDDHPQEWMSDLVLGRKLAPELLASLKSVAYYRLSTSSISSPSYSEHRRPLVEFDGTGLASAIAYMMTAERSTFEKLLAALRAVVPSVRDIRVKPAPVYQSVRRIIETGEGVSEAETSMKVSGQELFFDFANAADIPAHAASDGTLVTLGLLAILYSPTKPNLVLLDDLEQSLHPEAQGELIAQLRKILKKFPELQIIATTHSPYLVDALKPKEVWMLHHDSKGILKSGSLDSHPQAKKALRVLTTGEFWSSEGEMWVGRE